MECRDCRRSLTAFLDRELDAGREAELQGHLDRCLACREDYNSLEEVNKVAGQLTPPELPPFLWTRIQAGIVAGAPHRSSWPRRFRWWLRARWAPVAAGVLGGAVFSVFLFQGGEVESERQFRQYVQERERIEGRHSVALQERRRGMVPVLHLNPFRRDDRPLRDNPFQNHSALSRVSEP